MCKVVSQVSLDSMRLTLDTAGEGGGGGIGLLIIDRGETTVAPPSSPQSYHETMGVLTRLCFDRLAVRPSLSYLRFKGTWSPFIEILFQSSIPPAISRAGLRIIRLLIY